MTRMVRKQVYIRPDQNALLKRRARELGVPESELVRWGIDEATARPLKGPRDPEAWAAGSFVPYFPGIPMHYRSKWYVHRGPAPLLMGFGIHGQFLFVDRQRQIVIAKFSSQDLPSDGERIRLTTRAVSQIRDWIADSAGN